MITLISKTLKSLEHRAIWKYVLISFVLAFFAFFGIFELVASSVDDSHFFENRWLEMTA